MFKAVVWATDGSEHAGRALPYAQALATGEEAKLIAAHIIQETTTDGSDDEPASDGYGEDLETKITNMKVVNYVGPQPAQGIADIAKEVGADVIVIGT